MLLLGVSQEPGPPAHEVYTSLLAHELRTPVTSIFGYLQLLADDRLLDDPARLRRYLSMVRGRAAELARIVSELTNFSDVLAGTAPGRGQGVPPTLPLMVHQVIGSRAAEVQISAEAASAPVDLERGHLVLQQLVDNAFKFGTADSAVLVRASLEQDPMRLVVRVTNHGAPIDEALRQIIFAPFQQAQPPQTREHGGLGLGLTVARHAAEGAGGSVVLEPGQPTTFRLELPLREDPMARQARAWRDQAEQAEAQTLSAIRDVRALRETAARAQQARELAEAQQLRAVTDFRSAHREALTLAGRLDQAYLETISALARAVEARDNYTGGHVERVRQHSSRIGETLGLGGTALRQLEFGAVLHDVGKIGVPDAILAKTGPLGADEWTVMRSHPAIGRRVLEGITILAGALDAVGCHHERWDGEGYPNGLTGDAIPLFGRIVAIADAYDAMVSDRPYRRGLPVSAALAEIERGRGRQFDPDVAALFLVDPPRV